MCSGFTRWHCSMYIPRGTDTIKIPCKELCCRSKTALSSTSLKSKLSYLPYCSLIFSLPLRVRFRKKNSTSAVPNMTWLSVVPQSPLPPTMKDILCSFYYCWILYRPGSETMSGFQEIEAAERLCGLGKMNATHFQIPTLHACWERKSLQKCCFWVLADWQECLRKKL